MKRKLPLLVIAIVLSFAELAYTQSHCFGNCWENLDSITRNVPTAERYKAQYWMIQALEGCTMPDFTVNTIDNQVIDATFLKGKVVVFNFWFESCLPCRNELPGLNKLTEYFQENEVVFIAFGRDSEQSIRNFLSREAFHYLHVADCFNNDILEKFCIMGGFPTNMVFDKNGKLAYINTGGSISVQKRLEKFEQLKPVIEKCL